MLGLRPKFGIFPRKSLAETVMEQAIALNDIPGGMTFTRATSAWDPLLNQIVPPGTRRRKGEQVGRFRNFNGDLGEGASINLLAAGTSDRFNLWSSIVAQLAGGQIAPDGSATAWAVTDSSAVAFQSIQQTVTIPNNGLPYCWSLFVLKTSGGTSATFGINYAINGGTALTASGRFDTDNGVILNGAGGFAVTSAGIYWRISMVLTNNTSGNTNVNIAIFPATAANGQATDSAAATGTATIAWGQLEQSANPTSYISNRNLFLKSEQFQTTWTLTDTVVTQNALANPLNGLLTAQLLTEGTAGTAANVQAVTIIANSTMTASGYLFKGNNQWTLVRIKDAGSTNTVNGWFDLTNGVAGGTSLVGTGSAAAISLTSVPGNPGWYRWTLTGNIGSGVTAAQVLICSASANLSLTRLNNATRYQYGFQFEYGTTATTYWAVDATVGKRDQELLTATSAIGTGSGTIIALFTPYGWSGNLAGATAYLYDDGTTSGVLASYINSVGVAHSRRKDSIGVQDSPGPAATPSNGVLMQVANVWDGAHVTVYVNGVNGTPTATTPPYIASSSLKIGISQGATNQNNAYILLLYIPRALSAPEVQAVYNARSAA